MKINENLIPLFHSINQHSLNNQYMLDTGDVTINTLSPMISKSSDVVDVYINYNIDLKKNVK